MAMKLFGRTRKSIGQMDDFLTRLSECGMTFHEAVTTYLAEGASERFHERLTQVTEGESRADELRRSNQRDMYIETLMADARGDTLNLLESLDEIINTLEETLWYFSSEQP